MRDAERPRIHTFIATSPLHIEHKLQMTPRGGDRPGATRPSPGARNHTDDVEWSAEDATRTEIDFLCRMRRGRDQGRRHHDQPARHRRLRDAGGIQRDLHATLLRAGARTPTR